MRRFLSLGAMPLANAFLQSPEEFATEPRYPLDVYLCEGCSLVQLVDVIDPEVLFRHYLYQTGVSSTINGHNARLAELLTDRFRLTASDLVVEVASNDGSLLQCFRRLGVQTLGIEPATNLAAKAAQEGVPTVNAFFSRDTARQVRETHGPAQVLIANNVLAHVDEPRDFLQGCCELLQPDGRLSFEVPYLGDLVERLEYDTIYHEHLSYFSMTALAHLCQSAGLAIERIDRLPVHGGSLRVTAARAERLGGHQEEVWTLLRQEADSGLTRLPCFERFAERVRGNRDRLVGLLRELRTKGTVIGYGAPAKGNTLLNYCGIDAGLLPYVVDKNPLKVGLYTPGTHIPVQPVASLREQQPDYVLILPWNIADEVCEQEREYRRRGGRFIVPIPEPRFV